jgi:hypothetical protein
MSVPRLAAWTSAIAVSAALIAGFLLAGSPAEQRQERFDARRLADLQQLAWAVDDYRNEHGAVPDALGQVVDGRRLSQLPADPATAAPYAYESLPPDGYRLCATFDRPSPALAPEQFWAHPAGNHCFDLEARVTPRR